MKIVRLEDQDDKKVVEPKKPKTMRDKLLEVFFASLFLELFVNMVVLVLNPDENGSYNLIAGEMGILIIITLLLTLGIFILTIIGLYLNNHLRNIEEASDLTLISLLSIFGVIIFSFGYLFIFPAFPLLNDPFHLKSVNELLSFIYRFVYYYSLSFEILIFIILSILSLD